MQAKSITNLMSQEGVRGQEWNPWSVDGGNPCEHVTVLPYTRFLAGPVEEKTVSASDTLHIKMAQGGGFAAELVCFE